jgi:hypothetical protein
MDFSRRTVSEMASQISAAAAAEPAAGWAPVQDRAQLVGLSFARLFPGAGAAIAEAELAIRERTFAAAVRTVAHAIAEILDGLPGGEEAAASRATLLGLDGREYLRLCRLATRPDAAVTEQDALFALYLLVAAMLKAERI